MQKDVNKKGLQASVEGFAHEHIVAGILMKKFQNVSLVDLPLSPYDLIIVFKREKDTEEIIRAQVKTARKRIIFTGGTRGGVDREYKSGVKEYRQSTSISDVVIGIHPLKDNAYNLYFIPTILIEKLNQKSISIRKVEKLKNNYEILEHCRHHDWVLRKCKEFGII